MANTTDIIIVTPENDKAIAALNQKLKCQFRKISNAQLCGGEKIVWFDSYALCTKSLGKIEIEKVITAFLGSSLDADLSCLIIDDDNNEIPSQCIVKRHQSFVQYVHT